MTTLKEIILIVLGIIINGTLVYLMSSNTNKNDQRITDFKKCESAGMG